MGRRLGTHQVENVALGGRLAEGEKGGFQADGDQHDPHLGGADGDNHSHTDRDGGKADAPDDEEVSAGRAVGDDASRGREDDDDDGVDAAHQPENGAGVGEIDEEPLGSQQHKSLREEEEGVAPEVAGKRSVAEGAAGGAEGVAQAKGLRGVGGGRLFQPPARPSSPRG